MMMMMRKDMTKQWHGHFGIQRPQLTPSTVNQSINQRSIICRANVSHPPKLGWNLFRSLYINAHKHTHTQKDQDMM